MHPISTFNTSVNITTLSPKQLLGECIDLATKVFKDLILHFLQVNPDQQSSSPLPNNPNAVIVSLIY